ncbi:MAG: N-acetylglucosamine-6-phosphate deacetylase [Christensenellales bacterium]|jgi:N-acetylglucosamine-6-phosphate deacetylase
MDFCIRNAAVLLEGELRTGVDVRVREGIIAQIGPSLSAPETVDGEGLVLSPGFIDIHIHAIAGKECQDDDPDAIPHMARALVRHGVTSFLPTTATETVENLRRTLMRCAEWSGRDTGGAAVLGCHLEGPFLSMAKKGAQRGDCILPPTRENWLAIAGGYEKYVRLIAIAPENPGALDLIGYLAEQGITVSLAHTEADYETSMAAFDAGAREATHLFNGMVPLAHRSPGVVGAALVRDGVAAEIIADLVHLHPGTLALVARAKGPGGVVLISDAMAATDLSDGEYSLAGSRVFVRDRQARLQDGTLAGSTLTLEVAVRNMVRSVGVPLPQALGMATRNPARQIGETRRGRIETGCIADLVLLREDLSIESVYLGGVRAKI